MKNIIVEAVSDKFANKYNSGSVKAGGEWMQVSKDLDLDLFQKDSQITVETKTNDKGYTSIVGVVENGDIAQKPQETVKAKKASNPLAESKGRKESGTLSYDEAKSKRILVQGVLQAVVQSPSLAGLPFTSIDDVRVNVENLTKKLVEFVLEESK